MLLVTIGTAALERLPLHHRPKGFFPQQDTGRCAVSQAAQDISFRRHADRR